MANLASQPTLLTHPVLVLMWGRPGKPTYMYHASRHHSPEVQLRMYIVTAYDETPFPHCKQQCWGKKGKGRRSLCARLQAMVAQL